MEKWFRKKMMIASWYVKEAGDWMYFKGIGYCDYTSPHYCDHCGKWNFEDKGVINAK